MKNKSSFQASIAQLEHRGGKKLSQPSTEFFHKKKEVRKHRTAGGRGRKG
jgi:hypothetical protein